jgi:hypothetical protein
MACFRPVQKLYPSFCLPFSLAISHYAGPERAINKTPGNADITATQQREPVAQPRRVASRFYPVIHFFIQL